MVAASLATVLPQSTWRSTHKALSNVSRLMLSLTFVRFVPQNNCYLKNAAATFATGISNVTGLTSYYLTATGCSALP